MFDYPFLCYYYITYRCNSRCDFCDIWKNPANKKVSNAKFEDVKNNLDGLKKLGVKVVDFTGGEPLLNEDLPKILRYAKSLGFNVKLTTNGILYPKIAHEIKGQTDWLSFSFDGLNPEEYKTIRGVDNFDNLLESVRLAKKLKEKPFLIHTVTNDTVKDFEKVVNFAKENKIFVYINPVFSYFDNKGLDVKHIPFIRKHFWKPYIFMDLAYLTFLEKRGNDIKNPRCRAGISVLAVSPDNNLLLPCYHHSVEKIQIGTDLYDTYNSKKVQDILKKSGRYPFCKNCAINCYMGFSFMTKCDKYLFESLFSSVKFLVEKNLRRG